MIIARTVAELSEATGRDQRIALVPTMGALHRGHTSLMDEARRRADVVVASIFVNPLQFGDAADLAAYPSTLDSDLELCRRHGVDAVYCPEATTMYPPGFATTVHIGGITDVLEGRSRPGHFDGVSTVVTKLLNACRPHLAVFGQKDFQQVAVIRRLVNDLDFGVDILVVPTVRDSDGLALSSRNTRLDPGARREATSLWRGLSRAHEAYRTGQRDAATLCSVVHGECGGKSIDVDYVEAVDRDSLRPVARCDERTVILLAATVGGVRLIDNVLLDG